MESIVVYRGVEGAIIKYPNYISSSLVTKRHGHQKDTTTVDGDIKRRKRKRKQRLSLNKGEEEQAAHFSKVRDSIIKSYQSLKAIGHEIGHFPVQCDLPIHTTTTDSNGPLNDWAGLCELDKMIPLSEDINIFKLSQDDHGKCIDVFGKIIINSCTNDVHIIVCDSKVVVPAGSCFLLSDISKVQLLEQLSDKCSDKYNLIVLDPPWENRSAIRGGKYKWLGFNSILNLPISSLIAPGGIVAIWVTNKRQIVNWVIDTLLHHWRLTFVGEWTWIKVTTGGELVFDIESVHKKPYESLIIAINSGNLPHPKDFKLTSSELTTSNLTCESLQECSTNEPLIATSGSPKESALTTNCSPNESALTNNCSPKESALTNNCSPNESTIATNCSPNESLITSKILPSQFMILSVPSTVHSQKPYLGDLLKDYIDGELRGLEMFARNLLPGWTSWGNEVLLFP